MWSFISAFGIEASCPLEVINGSLKILNDKFPKFNNKILPLYCCIQNLHHSKKCHFQVEQAGSTCLRRDNSHPRILEIIEYNNLTLILIKSILSIGFLT